VTEGREKKITKKRKMKKIIEVKKLAEE